MIVRNPGAERITIFGACHPPGVYSILVKPFSGTQRNATTGRFVHILYEASGTGAGLEYQELASADQGTFTIADKTFAVEFDAGTFCLNTTGALYLTGGEPGGKVDVKLFRHLAIKPVLHWHRLTTRLAVAGTMAIPDYHSRVSAWTAAAGATLEGDPIDLPPGLWSDCIPGTTLSNGRAAAAMIQTQWWG